jgi:hypothetical protein
VGRGFGRALPRAAAPRPARAAHDPPQGDLRWTHADAAGAAS